MVWRRQAATRLLGGASPTLPLDRTKDVRQVVSAVQSDRLLYRPRRLEPQRGTERLKICGEIDGRRWRHSLRRG